MAIPSVKTVKFVEDPPRRVAPVVKTPQVTAVVSRQPDEPSPPPKPVKNSSPRPKPLKKRRPPPVQPIEAEALEPIEPPGFTSIHTLSLNDRRYSRMALSVDGIGVRVKDTESSGVADLDLFDGKKRIQKIRDLEVGRSQTFRGKSGALYRVTLLGVHHKSRTVRLGVKRA